jgi:hypothetical protein
MELSKSKGINRKAKSRPRSPLLEEGSLFPLPEGGYLCSKEAPSARRRFPLPEGGSLCLKEVSSA